MKEWRCVLVPSLLVSSMAVFVGYWPLNAYAVQKSTNFYRHLLIHTIPIRCSRWSQCGKFNFSHDRDREIDVLEILWKEID